MRNMIVRGDSFCRSFLDSWKLNWNRFLWNEMCVIWIRRNWEIWTLQQKKKIDKMIVIVVSALFTQRKTFTFNSVHQLQLNSPMSKWYTFYSMNRSNTYNYINNTITFVLIFNKWHIYSKTLPNNNITWIYATTKKKPIYSKGHLTLNLMYRLIGNVQLIAIDNKICDKPPNKSQP